MPARTKVDQGEMSTTTGGEDRIGREHSKTALAVGGEEMFALEITCVPRQKIRVNDNGLETRLYDD